MSVTNEHSQYAATLPLWQRTRDAYAGRDAIINRCLSRYYIDGNRNSEARLMGYLPPLSGQDRGEYMGYLLRSTWFGATGRTIDALAGLIFSKPPAIDLPAAIEPFADDITLSGVSLRDLAQKVVTEELTTSRVGIMVDYPAVDTAGLSVAQAEALNIRPYLRHYTAENINDWRCDMIGGVIQLTRVTLREMVDEPGKGEFDTVTVEQYRVLDLFEGVYRCRIFREAGNQWIVTEERIPTMRGAPMPFIPFTIIGGEDVRKPLLIDLADTNLAHFRNSADYEHGLHFTGLPQPYVTGATLEDGQKLQVGSSNAWVLPDPQSKAAFMEFSGQGLNALSDAMARKEHYMAILGARMLADEKRAAETQGTVELRTAGERSMLAAVANDVSEALTKCANWMAQWVGAPMTASVVLSTDYGVHRMEPTMLAQLVAAWQSGALPLQDLHANLERGEIVTEPFETYEARLNEAAPSIEAPTGDAPTASSLMGTLRQRLGL